MFSTKKPAAILDLSSPKLDVPSLEDVSPRYKALVERKTELIERRLNIEKQIQEESTKGTKTVKDRQDRVQELLDPNSGIASSSDDPHDVPSANFSYLQALAEELQNVKQALDQIGGLISSESLVASAAICEKLAPDHRRRVRSVIEAIVPLVDACNQYREFMDRVNDKNVAWSSLQPMFPMGLADRIGLYLDEAVKCGFATREELPEIRR